ncbi:hypothetical protein AV530_000635 [Patagioenas fasciata monilis]|uniref:Uncharacterized protein n=1 Tax=Patagioenas fasciata monilis TaxID=372326 RepID=A0A1V4IG59_PATFA|nr:hypothetical protein AV530_000635 [Patagioenas fasciata monilis]
MGLGEMRQVVDHGRKPEGELAWSQHPSVPSEQCHSKARTSVLNLNTEKGSNSAIKSPATTSCKLKHFG